MTGTPTIFALASAPGRAGVAVFRISGPQARATIARLCAPNDIPAPRTAHLRDIKKPDGETLDRALILFFESPNSFTGEDVVELHTHGGRAIINAVTETLASLPDFRLAEPGEFTRRAFENGKMDLTEAEAVADLVHAETEAQRKQALRQLNGALGQLYETWRMQLSRSLAYMEAAIDFADEELPPDMIDKQSAALRTLQNEISAHLNDNHRGERLREGFSIAIIGAPNAGKSSLLNALAKREAAIVSPTAGTTRDIIEVHLDIGGYAVTIADTAGLRDSTDAIESEGIRRARAVAARADLKLLLLDATTAAAPDFPIDADTILVANKSDIVNNSPRNPGAAPLPLREGLGEGYIGLSSILPISALTGTGIPELLKILAAEIAQRFDSSAAPPLTRARHRAALEECTAHLTRALTASMADKRAEDVRLAMRALGRITGRVDVEDLLDIIFRDFCIGK